MIKSDVTSPVLRHPNSAISSSSSDLNISSASATPCCPPSVSAHSMGRPTRTALAPRARHCVNKRKSNAYDGQKMSESL
jgi:hypothetical protein